MGVLQMKIFPFHFPASFLCQLSLSFFAHHFLTLPSFASLLIHSFIILILCYPLQFCLSFIFFLFLSVWHLPTAVCCQQHPVVTDSETTGVTLDTGKRYDTILSCPTLYDTYQRVSHHDHIC